METGFHGASGVDASGDEASRLAFARFATRDLPSYDRDAHIREFYGRISMGVDVEPLNGVPLEIDMSSLFLPQVIASVAMTTPLKWDRRGDLTADGNDDICIAWAAGGYAYGRPGHPDLEIAPETACLTPQDRRWNATTRDPSWKIAIQLERRALAERVPGLDDVAPDQINRRTPEGALLFDYQWALGRMAVTEAMAPKVAAHLVDLVALALGPSRDAREAAREGGVRAARLLALKRYIAANLHRSTLSARGAAHALGISERYVRSLLEREETTFSDYVADQRLDAIRHRLLQPSEAARPISEIAAELGFAVSSTFHRRFKARFGTSPSELRRP
jgi:AraC-like DNA-binding protein